MINSQETLTSRFMGCIISNCSTKFTIYVLLSNNISTESFHYVMEPTKIDFFFCSWNRRVYYSFLSPLSWPTDFSSPSWFVVECLFRSLFIIFRWFDQRIRYSFILSVIGSRYNSFLIPIFIYIHKEFVREILLGRSSIRYAVMENTVRR